MNNFIREPINGLTHLAGAILSLIALIAMIVKVALDNPTVIGLIAVTIFGVSMILLYATSATYHMVISSDTVINFLQRLDHSMIFVLIAGSYTPFLLNCIEWEIRMDSIQYCHFNCDLWDYFQACLV